MCGEKSGCSKPSECKGKPKDCSSEQIQKCHGDDKKHPCAKDENSE